MFLLTELHVAKHGGRIWDSRFGTRSAFLLICLPLVQNPNSNLKKKKKRQPGIEGRFLCLVSSQPPIHPFLCPYSIPGSCKPSGMCTLFRTNGIRATQNAGHLCSALESATSWQFSSWRGKSLWAERRVNAVTFTSGLMSFWKRFVRWNQGRSTLQGRSNPPGFQGMGFTLYPHPQDHC